MSEEAKKIIPVHTKDNIYKIISDCSLSEKEKLNCKDTYKKKYDFFKYTIF